MEILRWLLTIIILIAKYQLIKKLIKLFKLSRYF